MKKRLCIILRSIRINYTAFLQGTKCLRYKCDRLQRKKNHQSGTRFSATATGQEMKSRAPHPYRNF